VEPVLTLEGVCAGYPGRKVLERVSLSVGEGELCAVLGPNGAGKSTLVRCALGLHRPWAGQVRVAGQEAQAYPRRLLAQKVAWVPQRFEPAFGFSGLELAAMGRSPWHGPFGAPSPADHARAMAVLAELGISALASRSVAELSGGEQRLLLLARALVQEPRLLLLDEPTAFLDLRHQLEALRCVRQRVGQGLAALVVLHDVNLAAAFADQVVLLRGGQVLALGPAAEVLTAKRLEALYGVPMSRALDEGGQALFAPRLAR
jgi:iron complex transport system ATP-binding protein